MPPEPIRQLRDLTRTQRCLTAITREGSREIQRLEKLLEDAGIKLSSVASDIVGVSGRAMIEALIAGERDAGWMADLARRRMRVKIPQLTEALVGRFTGHHAFLARVHLDLIDGHTAVIDQLTERIEVMMEPFRGFHDLICTIPGISTRTADVVVAETGADMSRFPTAKYLASWAGTTPGNNESAGRVKSSRTRPGNPYLQGALGASAMSIARTPGTFLHARYRRIAPRAAKSQRRHPAHPPDRDLAHGSHRHPLRRPRRRLLHPPPARSNQTTGHPPARSHGLPRHARGNPTSLVELTTQPEEPGVFRTVILLGLCCLVFFEPVLLGLVRCDVPEGQVKPFLVVS